MLEVMDGRRRECGRVIDYEKMEWVQGLNVQKNSEKVVLGGVGEHECTHCRQQASYSELERES